MPGPPEDAPPPSLVRQINAAIEKQPGLRSLALTGLFVMAVVAVLYVARAVFVPLALAMVLSFLFRPFVRGLEKMFIPAMVGSSIVLAGLLGATAYGVVRLAEPATQWAERLPKALRTVERKVRPIRRSVDQVTEVAERVERITEVDKKKTREVRVEKPGLATTALSAFGRLAGGAIVMLIALYFMLIWGDSLLHRLIAFVPDLRSKKRAEQVIETIERKMSAYMGTVFLINAALGVAVAAAMEALKMPNAVLWGVLAFTLNFVPYLGSVVGIVVVGLASVVSFKDLGDAMLVPAAYFAITAIEGNVITPIVLGRAFRLSPLIIFVWLVFWAWLWGIVGALVAVPFLVLIKITCEQSPHLAPVADFLRR